MKTTKKLRKILCGFAAVSTVAMLLMPTSVNAMSDDGSDVNAETSNATSNDSGYIDTGKNGTLSIYYEYEGYGKMAGVKAHVFKLASISKSGEFTVEAPFDGLGLNIEDMNSISTHEQWDEITDKALKCVKENNVTPYAEATSGDDGFANLGTVETGLYYGYSDPVEIQGTRYIYYDVLASVPGPVMLDETGSNNWDGTWQNASYEVVVMPKREAIKLESDPEEFKVYKQWVDNGFADKRPKSIKVKIYKDGELFDTVTLDSSNNWQFDWKYEKGHKFTVEEEVDAANYTVSVTQNETSYVIVNTRKDDEGGGSEEGGNVDGNKEENGGGGGHESVKVEGGTGEGESGEVPSVLGAIRNFLGELPEVLGARRLPQTGQLWWPIPVLAILGLVLIIHGIRSEKRRKEH
ncbi:Cna B-type domain-containing protein [Butyrivibrio sp. WCD3002]|uniref:Cna B-type domain-containing protein n=1 Tax=Butyrivibrio sp. WCD3002 TaxID=1280676 RepID=UPI000425C0E4|nr:Cna B-type domain-containing protein [Butyrivibrio sp. WCD3002]